MASLFDHGSTWLRADFHLHTKADKEFRYEGNDSDFVRLYVEALKEAQISVGVITNHNKFDFAEYRAIQKRARKDDIMVLPGVELSINDGANGVHTLIVFSDEWLAGGKDHINPFLTAAFQPKHPSDYENENGRTSSGIKPILALLEDHHKDYFLIFAHVEDRSGLWNELDGGRLIELGRNDVFRRRTLAFQKVRTHDVRDRKCRTKVAGWLGDAYPAEVEGCDCKSLGEIGKGKTCFVHIGDYTFDAVKYALLDHSNRVSPRPHLIQRSYIERVQFDGGLLDGQAINLSAKLNTLIGIRGSGKSCVVEALRFALDIPFGDKSVDRDYKDGLIPFLLGSGGKVTVSTVDANRQRYVVTRIVGERPDVFVNATLQPGLSLHETVLRRPVYFGQKDLSSTGDGFERDLVEKLVAKDLEDIRKEIDKQAKKVRDCVRALEDSRTVDDDLRAHEKSLTDAKFRLSFYEEHDVASKLVRQVAFDNDDAKLNDLIETASSYTEALSQFITEQRGNLAREVGYESAQNADVFEEVDRLYRRLIKVLDRLMIVERHARAVIWRFGRSRSQLEARRAALKEEFASVERQLSEELQGAGAAAISPDEYKNLRRSITQAKNQIKKLREEGINRRKLHTKLTEEITALNELWRSEFQIISSALSSINASQDSLRIKAEFKGDKTAFLKQLVDVCKGSRIRESTLAMIADAYRDFATLYKGLEHAKTIVGKSGDTFEEYILSGLEDVITHQVPNKYTIEYRGKELKHHSLGQRASALMLFILSQHDHDVVIIDQPEDDLDNQTIYEDVITLVCRLKPEMQFIFATHNPNIPVLGDAEQVVACKYADAGITFSVGSIDSPAVQQHVIDIMEGGEEAFRKRRQIYEVWKPNVLSS